MSQVWRHCGSCKRSISHGGIYQVCSISSCKKHAYCSVHCWDVHNSILGHKSAYCVEERAPLESEADAPRRKRLVSKSTTFQSKKAPRDILIVASKLKDYVKAAHGLNTSAGVMEALSDQVRALVDTAINSAKAEGRKTLMDRDF